MKLNIKSLAAICLTAFIAIYFIACSSAEQTTGKLAFQQGDFQKAEKEFMKEAKANPNNEEAWYYLGATRLMLSKYKEAEDAFVQYRKIGKNSYASEITDAWTKRFNNGADKYNAGQKAKEPAEQLKLYKQAIDEFKVCKVIVPDSTVVDGYIKNINAKIAVVTIKPMIDKGVEYLDKNMYQESIDEFKKALGTNLEAGNPNYYIVQYNIGVAYLKWGEKLRTDNADNPDYKGHLDKYKDALTYLEEFTKSEDKKDQLTAYELLIQVYGNLNMTDKALDAIKKRDALKSEIK